MLSSNYVPTGQSRPLPCRKRNYNYRPYSVTSFLHPTYTLLCLLFFISNITCFWRGRPPNSHGDHFPRLKSDYCHVSQTSAKCIACHFRQVQQRITSTANATLWHFGVRKQLRSLNIMVPWLRAGRPVNGDSYVPGMVNRFSSSPYSLDSRAQPATYPLVIGVLFLW
jgi:hypothetical protein